MAFRNLLFLFMLMSMLNSFSSAQITFHKTYKGTGQYNIANAVLQTYDGGYIITGGTNFNAVIDGREFFLIKTDEFGNPSWTETFAGSNSQIYFTSNSIQQIPDSGFIVAGSFCDSTSLNMIDLYLVKIDYSGNIIWSKAYGNTDNEIAYDIKQTYDSGFIVAGTSKPALGSTDVFLLKTNSIGDTMWTRTFGGSDEDNTVSVQQSGDSGFIVAGYTKSYGAGRNDFYLIKTNKDGDTVWTKTYGGSGDEAATSMEKTLDNGFIIGGYSQTFGLGYDAYLIKIDNNGDTIWTKTYGENLDDVLYSIKQTNDSGFIITGLSGNICTSHNFLIKINSVGDTLWTRVYGGFRINSGQQTNDSGYIFAGQGINLIKTNNLGNTGCNIGSTNFITDSTTTLIGSTQSNITSGKQIQIPNALIINVVTTTTLCSPNGIFYSYDDKFFVAPNPFHDELFLRNTNEKGIAILFDISGKEILRLKTFNDETIINTNFLRNGFYFLSYQDENKKVNKMVVKF